MIPDRKIIDGGQQLDRQICVEPESRFARSIQQYREILTHNGAIDPIAYAQNALPANLTVVDAGCGVGLALMGMRPLFPAAKLHGIDLRDAHSLTLDGFSGERMLRRVFGIHFYRGNYTNIANLIPQGYDMLLSVDSFYDWEHPVLEQLDVLHRFYGGLRRSGIAEVLINPTQEQWDRMQEGLTGLQIPYTFTEGDPQRLEKQGIAVDFGILGSLVLGPKNS
ncbi:class I SAM-dependent methyltransferase [Candidatus Roizmanbacteria bacterium]|nr:class I SAM-dependent methyltransferase [Candidatus Roizmanbacteria bacterium]